MGSLLRVGEVVSEPKHRVKIERIRLTGLDVAPERADHVREMIEVELQRLLTQERGPETLVGGEVSRLDAPAIHVNRPHSDGQLAKGLAHSIARTLRGTG